MLKVLLPSIFLILACRYDGRIRRIPNEITYSMFWTGIAFSIFSDGLIGLKDSLSEVLMLLIILLFLNKAFKFGTGDVKLILACGAWLRKESIYFIAFLLGAIILYNAFLALKQDGLKNFLSRIGLEMLYGYKESFNAIPGAYFITFGFLTTIIFN